VNVKSRAEGVLIGLTVIWGSTFVIGKIVLQNMSPLQMIAFRFTISSVFFLVFFSRRLFPLNRRQILRGGFSGSFFSSGFLRRLWD